MKKNFFKKLALVLALVMVAASINYVPASAASAPAWKAKKTVISLGNTYTYGVKNVNKKYKVTYTSSKKTVGTINKTSGKFTAKKAGKTNLHAIVKNGSKTVKDLVQKVEVKAPAWKNTKSTMDAGERSTFTVSYKASGSTQKWSSSNKEVAKVSSKGSVLAVADGKTTITTKVYDKNGTRLKTLKTDVNVVSKETKLDAVKQTGITELELTMTGSTADVKYTDFTIKQKDSNIVIPVKSIAVDKTNAQKIALTTLADMTDAKTFVVSYKEANVEFVATNGEVKSLTVSPLTIQYEKATDIKVVEYDENGVALKTVKYADASSDTNLDFVITTDNGYFDSNNKLVLNAVGDTAKATVTYHTYKYENGEEIGMVKTEQTITAVEQAALATDITYTVGKMPGNWNTATLNKQVIVGKPASSYNIYIYAKDVNGDVVLNGQDKEKYTVSSSNPDVLVVNEDWTVAGAAAGTAYVLVKENNKLVWTLEVSVLAASKVSTIEMSAGSVSVSNATAAAQTVTIKFTVKDQYGNKYSSVDATGEVKSAPNSGSAKADFAAANTSVDGNVITQSTSAVYSIGYKGINGSASLPSGTYSLSYAFKDRNNSSITLYRNVNVFVQDATVGSQRYEVVISDDTKGSLLIDDSFDATDKMVSIKLGKYKGSVLTGYVDVTKGDVQIKKGTTVATTNELIDYDTNSGNDGVEFKAIAYDPGTYTVSKSSAGTYTVIITDPATSKEYKKTFTLTDKQPELKVTRDSQVVSNSAGDVTTAAYQALKFVYDGIELDKFDYTTRTNTSTDADDIKLSDIQVDKYVENVNGHSATIQQVTVWVPVAADGYDHATNAGTIYRVPITVKNLSLSITY